MQRQPTRDTYRNKLIGTKQIRALGTTALSGPAGDCRDLGKYPVHLILEQLGAHQGLKLVRVHGLVASLRCRTMFQVAYDSNRRDCYKG